VFAAAMSLSLPALAGPTGNCPPGAWFCADAEVQIPPPPVVQPPQVIVQPPVVVQPPVIEEEDEAPPVVAPPVRRSRKPRVVVQPAPQRAAQPPPPVVIYQPVPSAPPTRVIIITRGYGYGGYGGYAPPAYRTVRAAPPPPPPAPARACAPKRSEWGLNLRVEGLALGKGAAEHSGMGGLGLSLRYRPVPAFAFDAGVDILAGVDYNGFNRTETPLSLSGMLFVNPKSRVQFYLTGGMNYSHAKVKSDVNTSDLLQRTKDGEFGAEYSYFGGQGGAGLEFRISKHLALGIDGIGFARHRVDHGTNPEFKDPKTGNDTKNSGGGLFRGGLSFWW
jgi:opacity protein-like surface antigen